MKHQAFLYSTTFNTTDFRGKLIISLIKILSQILFSQYNNVSLLIDYLIRFLDMYASLVSS